MLNKYSENSNSVDEIMDQVEILRNVNKSPPEEFIAAESIEKTKSGKIKKIKTIKIKNSTMNQNTNSKQTIHYTSSIISINKTWKLFIQAKNLTLKSNLLASVIGGDVTMGTY